MDPILMIPGPTNVPPEVLKAMVSPMIDHRSAEFHELHREIVEGLKYVMQTDNEVFVLSSSGTGAVECAIANVVRAGDKVVVPTYGAFSERMKYAVEVWGGKTITISIEEGRGPMRGTLEEVFDKEKDIKAIVLVYNETSPGVTVRELNRISELAKDNGSLVIVDAMSILGGDELPVDKWNIDMCVSATQKCIAAPPGLSMISVSEDSWKAIEEGAPRTYYFDLRLYRKFAERREAPFTPAIPLLFALNAALRLVREEGLERRIKRHKICASAFYEALETFGLTLFVEKEFRSNTVIAARYPEGVNSREFRSEVRKRYDVLIADGMAPLSGVIFRIGNMGLISRKEVLLTLMAIGNTLRSLGVEVNLWDGMRRAEEILSVLQ